MGIRVGIDLGTTFSAVARIDPVTGRASVIKNRFGSATTPSVLCFRPDGSVLFGEEAKEEQSMGNANAVAFFKRSMGNDLFAAEILGRTYSATDLSAIFLKHLKADAERSCGETIDAAVITVPAYFTHKERAATIEAGKRAGIDVLSIINEPTAAAFAYGLNEKSGEQTVLIYDLGGGTFDVTLARIDRDQIDILGSDGDHELGGKDWDDCIARYLANEFQERYGADISDDPEASAALLVTAENVKKQLTVRDRVNVPLVFGGVRGQIEMTEETFEAISQFLIGTTKEVTERLLASVGVGWNAIDGVILVGGSTRMRMIRGYVKAMSGREPLSGVNVDEAVALGAAIRANITDDGKAVPALGGKRKQDAFPLIPGAKRVTDVTAHSLGMIAISKDGEKYVNSIIIPKNTKIPAENTRPFQFRTRARGGNELEIYVVQGEFPRPLDNAIVHKYVIADIPHVSGASVIEVTYRYTANGIIEVSAVQKETGKTLPIRIEPVPEDMSWTDGSPQDNASGGGTPQNVAVFLTVDLSGSMSGTPLRAAKKAMKSFVDEMDPEIVSVGLIPFSDRVKCVIQPTKDYPKVKKLIDGMSIGTEYGYGNDGHPFKLGRSELDAVDADIRYIIVLTDGVWSRNCARDAIKCAHECHAEGIEVMALGFGEADRDFLKKIASTDEFASLTDLAELSSSFSKIAQAIGDGVTGLSM